MVCGGLWFLRKPRLQASPPQPLFIFQGVLKHLKTLKPLNVLRTIFLKVPDAPEPLDSSPNELLKDLCKVFVNPSVASTSTAKGFCKDLRALNLKSERLFVIIHKKPGA